MERTSLLVFNKVIDISTSAELKFLWPLWLNASLALTWSQVQIAVEGLSVIIRNVFLRSDCRMSRSRSAF